MTAKTTDGPDYASASLPRHLARGAVGFGALAGAVALLPVVGPVGLLLLPAGLFALRGCPMCWAVGLAQTVSRGRLRRSCEGGQCSLTVAGGPEGPVRGRGLRRV
ncbi:hypothetical protein LG634_04440 [Streptomyces bambusae]|uniref:hypothetical protein n=1 Tax=Streptomyces bambusae TaxID=1550616 RepID=UPI001CFDEF23|nr:hypothetical protein [Streptomyces bambusae]MCB5164085.1 hypothetical protein [Streptomyces bambusae]